MQVKPEMLLALNLGPAVMAPSRTNGFLNMLETMRKRTVMLTEQLPKFPSLHITGDAVTPEGSFAEAQAKYLSPDASQVDALVQVTTLLHRITKHDEQCKYARTVLFWAVSWIHNVWLSL